MSRQTRSAKYWFGPEHDCIILKYDDLIKPPQLQPSRLFSQRYSVFLPYDVRLPPSNVQLDIDFNFSVRFSPQAAATLNLNERIHGSHMTTLMTYLDCDSNVRSDFRTRFANDAIVTIEKGTVVGTINVYRSFI